MAVLQKIRVKFGLAISIIIALALLSFIIDPGTLQSAMQTMSSKYDVGKINGKNISYTDFLEDVEKYTTINEMLELSMRESESTVSDLEKKDVLCNELGRTALQGFKDENSKDVELRFTSDVDDDFTSRTNAYRLNVALHHL